MDLHTGSPNVSLLLNTLALGPDLLPEVVDPVDAPAILDVWAKCPFCGDVRKYTDQTKRIAAVLLEKVNVKCPKCTQIVVLVPVPKPPTTVEQALLKGTE